MAEQTNRPTEHFRHEHEHLMHHLAEMRQTLDRMRTRVSEHEVKDLEGADNFLRNILIAHAQWEEQHLYPVADHMIKEFNSDATETMKVDHQDLVARITEFAGAVQALAKEKNPQPDEAAIDRLRRMGYQIDAILSLHFRKEEDVYLRLIDEHMSQEEFDRTLGSAHAGHEH